VSFAAVVDFHVVSVPFSCAVSPVEASFKYTSAVAVPPLRAALLTIETPVIEPALKA
jgi:hypothetical protein